MALKDKSLYPDQTPDTQKMYGLFDSGKMAMIVTGPWQLEDIKDHGVSYGVQVLPSFNGSHETISGPDVYMVFNHSDAAPQGRGHVPLVAAPAGAGPAVGHRQRATCPLSAKTAALPGMKKYDSKYVGIDLFVKNLQNAHHIRPPVAGYTAGLGGGRQGDRDLAARARQSQGHARLRRPRPPTKRCPEPWRRSPAARPRPPAWRRALPENLTAWSFVLPASRARARARASSP